MSYKQLYDFAQTLTPKISRRDLRNKTLELAHVPSVRHARTTMDISVCRGMYLTPQNNSSPVVSLLGKHVIVTARGLNYCWERFVYIKELMHMFGDRSGATDSGEKFESLLNEFSASTNDISPQMRSEFDSFWMALGVLCPESTRKEYHQMRNKREIDDYTIACNLRIPQQYVGRLFEARYLPSIERLTSN